MRWLIGLLLGGLHALFHRRFRKDCHRCWQALLCPRPESPHQLYLSQLRANRKERQP